MIYELVSPIKVEGLTPVAVAVSGGGEFHASASVPFLVVTELADLARSTFLGVVDQAVVDHFGDFLALAERSFIVAWLADGADGVERPAAFSESAEGHAGLVVDPDESGSAVVADSVGLVDFASIDDGGGLHAFTGLDKVSGVAEGADRSSDFAVSDALGSVGVEGSGRALNANTSGGVVLASGNDGGGSHANVGGDVISSVAERADGSGGVDAAVGDSGGAEGASGGVGEVVGSRAASASVGVVGFNAVGVGRVASASAADELVSGVADSAAGVVGEVLAVSSVVGNPAGVSVEDASSGAFEALSGTGVVSASGDGGGDGNAEASAQVESVGADNAAGGGVESAVIDLSGDDGVASVGGAVDVESFLAVQASGGGRVLEAVGDGGGGLNAVARGQVVGLRASQASERGAVVVAHEDGEGRGLADVGSSEVVVRRAFGADSLAGGGGSSVDSAVLGDGSGDSGVKGGAEDLSSRSVDGVEVGGASGADRNRAGGSVSDAVVDVIGGGDSDASVVAQVESVGAEDASIGGGEASAVLDGGDGDAVVSHGRVVESGNAVLALGDGGVHVAVGHGGNRANGTGGADGEVRKALDAGGGGGVELAVGHSGGDGEASVSVEEESGIAELADVGGGVDGAVGDVLNGLALISDQLEVVLAEHAGGRVAVSDAVSDGGGDGSASVTGEVESIGAHEAGGGALAGAVGDGGEERSANSAGEVHSGVAELADSVRRVDGAVGDDSGHGGAVSSRHEVSADAARASAEGVVVEAVSDSSGDGLADVVVEVVVGVAVGAGSGTVVEGAVSDGGSHATAVSAGHDVVSFVADQTAGDVAELLAVSDNQRALVGSDVVGIGEDVVEQVIMEAVIESGGVGRALVAVAAASASGSGGGHAVLNLLEADSAEDEVSGGARSADSIIRVDGAVVNHIGDSSADSVAVGVVLRSALNAGIRKAGVDLAFVVGVEITTASAALLDPALVANRAASLGVVVGASGDVGRVASAAAVRVESIQRVASDAVLSDLTDSQARVRRTCAAHPGQDHGQ